MAKEYSTRVSPRYQSVYVNTRKPDKETVKIMRQEIVKYRKNLLGAQARLKAKASKKSGYEYNARLEQAIRDIKLKDLHTDRQIQNAWNRLREISGYEHASITNINITNGYRVESLHQRGYDFVTTKNIVNFGKFMNYVKDRSNSKLYDSEQAATFLREHTELLNNADVEKLFREWEKNN